jgi:putative radical SAM enzyme (TIGR03279 family)
MTVTRKRRTALEPVEPGLIADVAAGSLGEEIGLRPGHRVLSVNGHPISDALDFQYQADGEEILLEVDRGSDIDEFEIERDIDEPWGITFGDPTFDGVHLCENTCPFCFIKQLPKGMRKSLYVMDDDYRYSMLYGNFVTLTNLTEEDWQRIEEQHLSPINVSVHATNPELRVALVGNPKAAEIMEHLARLERAGIEYNTQLVLCPGVNDGPELDRTVRDLLTLGSHLRSIAAVPVGLSKFGIERQSRRVRLSRTCMRTLPDATVNVRRYTPDEAERVIQQVEAWQVQFRTERGRTFLYLGDEFYLMTGRPVAPARLYDGFPQVEDGIGITRLFVDDAERVLKRPASRSAAGRSGVIVCGTLIAPTMQTLVQRLNAHVGSALRVVPIENTFFGSEINVSGLLTGGLVRDALRDDTRRDPVFVSKTMLSRRTQTFLDDMHAEDLQTELRRPVVAAEFLSQVLEHAAAERRPILA